MNLIIKKISKIFQKISFQIKLFFLELFVVQLLRKIAKPFFFYDLTDTLQQINLICNIIIVVLTKKKKNILFYL